VGCGPKGLHADIGSLKGSEFIGIWLAKKFLFASGPIGIWIKIHLNPMIGILALFFGILLQV
jgi:hypothetical protein